MSITYRRFGNGRNTSVSLNGQHIGSIADYGSNFRFSTLEGHRGRSHKSMDGVKAELELMARNLDRINAAEAGQ